ncbi:TIGR02444 family protein [Aliihoeflea sp. PC F10.4]
MRLWDFALEFYARDGVAPLCLELQDRAGVDVNVLIYMVWLASHNEGKFSDADIERADKYTQEWRDNVVRPLRAVRRYLKLTSAFASRERTETLRDNVKAIELDCERIEIDALELSNPVDNNLFILISKDDINSIFNQINNYYLMGDGPTRAAN